MSSIKVTTNISRQLIADLMVTVIETPVLEWLNSVNVNHANPSAATKPDYSDPEIYNEHVQILVTFDDPDDEEGSFDGKKMLTWEDFKKGFEKLSLLKPNVMQRVVSQDYDAGDADTWFQFVVLGEEVYG